MGQFSWIYSDTKKAMKDDVVADSYLLVPPEFQEEYGEYIKETCYDGYGNMGGYDIYSLVALWNRRCLPSLADILKKPELSKFGGLFPFEKQDLLKAGHTEEEIEKIDRERRLEYYNNALKEYEGTFKTLEIFSTSEKEYDPILDCEFLRLIGIKIACYDEDNKKLKYPIKITSKPMAYVDVKYSKGDPNQGW